MVMSAFRTLQSLFFIALLCSCSARRVHTELSLADSTTAHSSHLQQTTAVQTLEETTCEEVWGSNDSPTTLRRVQIRKMTNQTRESKRTDSLAQQKLMQIQTQQQQTPTSAYSSPWGIGIATALGISIGLSIVRLINKQSKT